MKLFALFFLLYLPIFGQNLNPPSKTVRFIYLVSKDRKLNPEYQKAIEVAAKSIQSWYKKQLNGYTFRLTTPIVQVLYSNKNADFFYTNPNGQDEDDWGYNNTFAEVERLIGAKHFDKNYVYVIYSDGPGNKGRGGSGVCIMPEDDLLGLIGKHPEQKDVKRWIAGLGHEGGHAFGLGHPKDTDKDADAIMWGGIYGKYPDKTYLTEEDKEILSENPFFFNDKGESIAGEDIEIDRYNYKNGKFIRNENSKTKVISWVEVTQTNKFYFSEKEEDEQFYFLKANDRNIEIKIPIQKGQSYISTDGGNSWRKFYMLE